MKNTPLRYASAIAARIVARTSSMLRLAAVVLLSFALSTTAAAQVRTDEGNAAAIVSDRNLAGCNYTSYFTLRNHFALLGDTLLTPAPEGYEAFYVSTYARHGSRFMLKPEQYSRPISFLSTAARRHQLTPRGHVLLQQLNLLRRFCPDEQLGVLTDVGRQQHRSIAHRLCTNYPSVFDAEGDILAQSSSSERCVISMQEAASVVSLLTGSEVQQLYGHSDVQHRIAGSYTSDEMKALEDSVKELYSADQLANVPYASFCDTLFRSDSWARPELFCTFCIDVFHLAQNVQSHAFDINLWDFFTAEEIAALCAIDNRYWYHRLGASPATRRLMPQKARPQLRDIIAGADSIVSRQNWHGANLRYGHDLCLLPLACLMQLGTCGTSISEDAIGSLDRFWRCQEIFPMAGNIQLVFYRPLSGSGDVLVKALLNEREVTLPAAPFDGPYYRWKDVREQWMQELGE